MAKILKRDMLGSTGLWPPIPGGEVPDAKNDSPQRQAVVYKKVPVGTGKKAPELVQGRWVQP